MSGVLIIKINYDFWETGFEVEKRHGERTSEDHYNL